MKQAKTKAELTVELESAQKRIARLERALKKAQLEAQGRLPESALHKLFEILPAGVSILDGGGKLIFENYALETILGITRDGLLGGLYRNRKYIAADGTPMQPQNFASAQAAQSGQAAYNVETGVVKENGETVWVNVSAVPVDFLDWKTVVVTADISDRKRAEEAISGLAKFPSQNPNPVMRVNFNGVLLYANAACLPFLQTWRRHVGGTVPGNWMEIIASVQQTGHAHEVEMTLNGRVFACNFMPIMEAGYVNVYCRDITERKHIEDELRRSNAELEQFAYIASHDLQEPLRAMAGMVQLLEQRYKGQLDERADEYILHAVDASNRMARLINDLLAYSRVDQRGKPLEPVNSAACVQAAILNLDTAIRESGAKVTCEDLPTVTANGFQLTQLFQNLIGNSLKFRGQREPRVEIRAMKLNDAWQFSVCDNGIGIEPQYFERIFLVFQRLHTRREYPGTGIGLALCKKIVERHGGRIWVESEPGQGSTFHFTIPFRSNL